jgi:hypothetical protein
VPAPEIVTLDVWTVAAQAVPRALWRMAADRRAVPQLPGAQFGKLLGTGDGTTFTVRDADPLHWAVLVTWTSVADADRYETSRPVRAWRGFATERLQVRLSPLSSRGSWSGHEPFGSSRTAQDDGGPVASITRARLRPTKAASFWRAVPPVATDLHTVPGLRCAIGVGEAPLGYQGTFSLWESAKAMKEFAHRREAHRAVMARTPREGWYAEELFARFRVLEVRGTLGGRTP